MIVKTQLRPFHVAILPAVALLTGCGGSLPGLDLSLINSTPASEEGSPSAGQTQLAALSPEETPPVPARKPGKRARQPAQAAQPPAATDPVTTQTATAEPAKSEGFSLASLGNMNLFSASAGDGPDSLLMDKPPIEAYSVLAQRIKYCWLNPTVPRLTNHGFHAEIAPGDVREAKMVVYEKAPDGRRGTSAYKIDISAEPSGSLVSTQNVRLSKTDESAFKADLARWAKGDDRCKA